jgi:positive regulator of sigma E activity
MYREEFYEEGIVKETNEGLAVVNIDPFCIRADNCKNCAAKSYCRLNDKNENLLIAKDTCGVIPGDKVLVSIKGVNIPKPAILFYILPLIILIAGFWAGMNLFISNREIFSVLFAFGMVGIYSLLISFISKRKDFNLTALPEITSINHSVA